MVILTSIERETVEVLLKGKARAHSCPDLPLGDSSNKYGVQEMRAVILCFGIRTGQEDDALMQWLPRSPDLTPCDFFLWEFVKDTVFVPPLPANLRIFATVSPLLWLWSTVIC